MRIFYVPYFPRGWGNSRQDVFSHLPSTLGNFNRKAHYNNQCRYVYATSNFKAVKLHNYDQINASLRL